MPGILPMKVIKVGTSTQTRIAQACDRCRSKKIRCDGIRPSCSQCLNVGFECKTSDKLSRRAFPRGYTESLEERVRALEAEVRELKDLLDEKDEKIDMLSRLRSQSPQTRRKSSTPITTTKAEDSNSQEKDEMFKVAQSPTLIDGSDCEPYFMGTSSGRTLLDAFKMKLQDTGLPGADLNLNAFVGMDNKSSTGTVKPQVVCWQAPARLASDQMVNIFFQEWAPLFPILHRPTFLALYEDYVSCPEAMDDKKSLAQLNLVFSIAAQSSDSHLSQDIEPFETQWQAALEQFFMDGSIVTLQCLLLAQISCLQKGDHARLLQYKGLAISLSQRLGLHQSQKRFVLGALTSETRKKLFWTLYTLDCFSAAQLGLPRLLREDDVQCEYPADADDEYITEKGFLPTLPGEFTKLSSALALFKVARTLAKVLAENYPASALHEISFRKLIALSDELDAWSQDLPTHLRLQFVQEKPSTNIISSRSPLLSLAYHYIRSLIYRPAMCASAAIGEIAGSAKVAVASSSKHIIQILQLLEERNLAFSFCLNKNELLVLTGIGLLFQNLDLEGGGALLRENQRLINSVSTSLDRTPSMASVEFRRINNALNTQQSSEPRRMPMLSRHNSDSNLNGAQDAMSSAQKHIRALMSRFSSNSRNFRSDSGDRRATLPAVTLGNHLNQSQASISSICSEPTIARSESNFSPPLPHPGLSLPKFSRRPSRSAPRKITNLDYLPLGSEANVTAAYPYATNTNGKSNVNDTDWARLLGSLDNGRTNIYDGIYGGPPVDALLDVSPLPSAVESNFWSPDVWAIGHESISNLQIAPPPQSVLSFSDESLTSGEEFTDLPSNSSESYRGILIPEMSTPSVENFGLPGLDGNFGL